MPGMFRAAIILFLLTLAPAHADHVIATGGPALRKWENFRIKKDQHDRWWANFVRASTLRMAEIRTQKGPDAPIVWMVYKPAYTARGREDSKPYTTWITELAAKRRATLIWFDSGETFIQALNSRPRRSVKTFDFLGHSNRHAFMFDYGSDIMAASTAWLHERDLPKIKGSVFDRDALCKSWGCHTGESMTKAWRKSVGVPLEGAKGPTDYTVLSQGQLPIVKGTWTR